VAAAARATRWLDGQIGKVDPKHMDTFGATYLLDYFLDLEEAGARGRGNVPAAVQLLTAAQCPHGGWSYSYRFGVDWKGGIGGWPVTDKGREHSMNTGPALLALARAKERGHAVPDDVLAKGKKALLAMRDTAGAYTYTYPEPRTFNQPEQSIGRGCGCEHALRKLGAVTPGDLGTAIELFLKHRGGLRAPVKLTEAWVTPGRYADYFYFFAYDHAARAIAEHGEAAPERLGQLRSDLLAVAEADGTWVDCPMIGKPYGTAMALHVLYLARRAEKA
jgi:hypothetical protein